MKAVILAGGLGSRISEETYLRPKPMVMIGDKPILWHIMRKFRSHGIREFVICLGYKGEVIKDYFLNFKTFNSEFTVDLSTGQLNLYRDLEEDWIVTLVDTGASSNTAERLKKVREHVQEESFFFTYGDGLSNQDLIETWKFHEMKEKLVTLTAVNPPARYGAVKVDSGLVSTFAEKVTSEHSLINGGFFLVNRQIFNLLEGMSNPSWELEVLPHLAKIGELAAFEHKGFWFAMDTLRDKEYLDQLWESGVAPWLD